MKTNTHRTSAGAGADLRARADVVSGSRKRLPVTEGLAPLPSDVLLRLGTLICEQQVGGLMGTEQEAHTARGVQAGIVATLHAVLPAEQFRQVMIQWDIDAIRLSELLHIAGGNQQEETENAEALDV